MLPFLWIVHCHCPSVCSNVYLSCVLCTLCCQFLWIIHFRLPLQYALTFICPVSCVPYVAGFSGFFIFIAPSVCSNIYLQFLWILHCYCPSVCSSVYLFCVLCTLCCRFSGFFIVIALRYALTFICSVSCVPYVAVSLDSSLLLPFGML